MGNTSSRREDRPRRKGEDVIAWAEETGRVTAKSALKWRTRLKAGTVAERDVEQLASMYPSAANASSSTRPRAASAESPAALMLGAMTGGDSTYQDILKAGVSVPELFPGSGELPAQTASGMDPGKLAAAPWWTRPAIAEAPTMAKASELLALAIDDPDLAEASDRAFTGAAGYGAFVHELQAAAMNATEVVEGQRVDAQIAAARQARVAAAAAPVREPSEDELYDAVFGERDRHLETLRASQRRGGVEMRGYWDGSPR